MTWRAESAFIIYDVDLSSVAVLPSLLTCWLVTTFIRQLFCTWSNDDDVLPTFQRDNPLSHTRQPLQTLGIFASSHRMITEISLWGRYFDLLKIYLLLYHLNCVYTNCQIVNSQNQEVIRSIFNFLYLTCQYGDGLLSRSARGQQVKEFESTAVIFARVLQVELAKPLPWPGWSWLRIQVSGASKP